MVLRKAQTPILNSLERLEQMVSASITIPPSPGAVMIPQQGQNDDGRPVKAADSRVGAPARRALASPPKKFDLSWGSWGVRGSLVTIQEGIRTEHNLTFSLSLCLAKILGRYAVGGILVLRSAPSCRNVFSLRHPSYFGVSRIIDGSDPFMKACYSGDRALVRGLLEAGLGRPTDVTDEGSTPMLVSRNFCSTTM